MKDPKALAGWINEHVAFKAAEDSRKLTLPANAGAYEAKLPESFKAPDGVKFEFKADDPLLAQARTIAHAAGMSQEKFSEMLGVYAGAQVASQEAIKTARNAEVAKLGAAGPARVDALSTFFKAHLGDAEGTQLMSRAFLASDVQILEKLVAKMTTQGGASLTGTGREPPAAPGKVTEEQFAKMSAAARLDYVRQHNQQKVA